MKGNWTNQFYEPENELIRVLDVGLEYDADHGRVKALDKINFHIYRGEFVCVLGPSGCGKSTLLKILAGFISPTEGEVYLEGEKIHGTDWHRGVVFQNPPLYEWMNVEKNVSFGPRMRKIPKKEYRQDVAEYLEKVGLTEFAKKKVYELSGGMRQRVSIARALINKPDILLMDEPFGALDAFTRETMQQLIRSIWWESGKTVFFITHDVEEALMLGTRVLVLSAHPGRIVEDLSLPFSTRIMQEQLSDLQFSDEFYEKREHLLKIIHEQQKGGKYGVEL